MALTRRDLAAAGVLAFGAAAFTGTARADAADEAAVKAAVEEMKVAYLKQDKAKLEAMIASADLQPFRCPDRGQRKVFKWGHRSEGDRQIAGIPDMTVQISGNTAIVRHLWVSQTELDGKVTDTKIGVMQV